jgi:hypothetical protein
MKGDSFRRHLTIALGIAACEIRGARMMNVFMLMNLGIQVQELKDMMLGNYFLHFANIPHA